MSLYSVNGIELEIPVPEESTFGTLIQFLQNNYVSEKTLIASVRVNGNEINTSDEKELSTVPISELKTIEVFTAHPHEIAQDTLQNLLEYTFFLEKLSIETAAEIRKPKFYTLLTQLVDGISTFTEAIRTVKRVLRIGMLQSINVLEVDLTSILRDLLSGQENSQFDHVAELLQQHLPVNLRQWREEGLPVLIRARDS